MSRGQPMIAFRPLPVLSLVCLVALVILTMLGRWQWSRFVAAEAAVAVPVSETVLTGYSPETSGVLLVAGALNGEPGWRVFAPVRQGATITFVDAAFVPGPALPDPALVPYPPQLTYNAPIRGVRLTPRPPGQFAAPPDLAARAFYAIDLPAMAAALGLTGPVAESYIATAYIGTDGRAVANPVGDSAAQPRLPPARHAGYAMTWWGLGLALVALYFAYHVQAGRLQIRVKRP
jgi:surfeit locus 1 family protein